VGIEPVSQRTRVWALIDAVAPCWAGEALVAARYFGGSHRTRERDVRWIGFQIFKEHTGGGVYGGPGENVASILRAASLRAAEITLRTCPLEVDRILGDLTFAVDELRHMTQYMRLYALAGGDPARSIESLGQLENAVRLTSLRQDLRRTEVGHTAVALSEGGGLGLHFGMDDHFKRQPPVGEVDVEMARLTRAILADETGHLRSRFRATRDLDDRDSTWSELQAKLLAIGTQKLRERNEQFSHPLADEEIEGITTEHALGQRYIRDHLGFLCDGA
jgi:hypothetical protein